MSYADQGQGGRKTAGLVGVILLHVALGYAFITGLAFNVIKKAASDLKTFDVKDEPPPPPQKLPPPPPIPKNLPPPPIVAPPPIVQTPTIAPPIQTVQTPPPPQPVVIHEEAKPAPPPPSVASPLKPRGDPSEWLSSDDYPSDAQRDQAQGVTGFKLDVDASGRVTNCEVTSSSGNASLDAQTCKLLPRRARFAPAKDAQGNGMASTYVSRTRWVLPKD